MQMVVNSPMVTSGLISSTDGLTLIEHSYPQPQGGLKTMDWYVLILRIIHIGAGVFWAGVGMFSPLFLEKAVKEAGPAGPRVMGALVTRTRFTMVMASAAGLTILSGLLLYVRDSGMFQNVAWMSSGFGVMMTIGGLAGIVAAGFGGNVGRLGRELAAIGAEVEKSGGAPSAEQGARLQAISGRMSQFGRITAIAVAISVLCMATARYVIF
jgi:hypothetical protein